MQWICQICQAWFSTRSAFVEHVRRDHPTSFADHQLPALVDMCSRPAARGIIGKCPLCFLDNQSVYRHVSKHLMGLALFALPRRDDDTFEDEESDDSQMGSSTGDASDNKSDGSDSGIMSDVSESAEPIPDQTPWVTEDAKISTLHENLNMTTSADFRAPTDESENTIWHQAYHIVRKQGQWASYENALQEEMKGQTSFLAFVKERTSIIEEPAWFHESKKNAEVRQVVRAVLLMRENMNSERATTESEALVWVGICLFLPALLDPLIDAEGSEDTFDLAGVEDAVLYMTSLATELHVLQQMFSEQASHAPEDDQNDMMVQFCSHLFTAQSEAVLQLLIEKVPADNTPFRKLIPDLKKLEAACIESIDNTSFKKRIAQQENRMGELFRVQRHRWQNATGTQEHSAPKIEAKKHSETRYELHSLEECLNSLHTSAYEAAKSRIPDGFPGTCVWVLQHPIYHSWFHSTTSSCVLCIYGRPGFGKSVLSRSLIDNELHSSESLVTCYYFFCSASANSQDAVDALSALLHQMCSQNSILLMKANEAFRRNGGRTKRSFSWLKDLLISLVQSLDNGKIICVLDALDECEEHSRSCLVQFLNMLHDKTGSLHDRLRFLITSRQFIHIKADLESDILTISGDSEFAAMKPEIDLVIRQEVTRIAHDKALDSENESALRSRLFQTQGQTYLWLRLALTAVEEASGVMAPKQMARFIESLPQELGQTYEILLELSPARERLDRMLHLVVAAVRPLTLHEINMALNIKEGQRSQDDARLQSRELVAKYIDSISKSILTVNNDRVYYAHHTVKDWWYDRRVPVEPGLRIPAQSEVSHYILVKACFLYLSLDEFSVDTPSKNPAEEKDHKSRAEYSNRQRQILEYARAHDFLEYAAMHWTKHFELAGELARGLLNSWITMCRTESGQFYTWFRVHWYGHGLHNHLESKWNIPAFSALTLASFFTHYISAYALIEWGHDLEVKDGRGWSPLIAAIDRKATTVAALLIQKGASVTSETLEEWTPLGLAASRGSDRIVQYLIEKGADVQQQTRIVGITPLGRASAAGHITTVEFLVRQGADANTSDNAGCTPLMRSSRAGHLSITEKLLDLGADANTVTHSGWTALHYAIANSHEEVAQMLLMYGADIRAKDDNERTPLSWAARRGLNRIIANLISRGADVEAKDDEGCSPLMNAVRFGHDAVAQELLNGGADVNTADDQSQTALSRAVQLNKPRIVRKLLDQGASTEICDERGSTALHHAVSLHDYSIIQILLAAGANPNSRDLNDQTPLMHACSASSEEVIQLLLKHPGIDVNVFDSQGRTALSAAIQRSESVILALSDAGADTKIADNAGKTPLHHAVASSRGKPGTLLSCGAQADRRDNEGKTPLDIAREKGDERLVTLLEASQL